MIWEIHIKSWQLTQLSWAFLGCHQEVNRPSNCPADALAVSPHHTLDMPMAQCHSVRVALIIVLQVSLVFGTILGGALPAGSAFRGHSWLGSEDHLGYVESNSGRSHAKQAS